jgi:hypothetical protein
VTRECASCDPQFTVAKMRYLTHRSSNAALMRQLFLLLATDRSVFRACLLNRVGERWHVYRCPGVSRLGLKWLTYFLFVRGFNRKRVSSLFSAVGVTHFQPAIPVCAATPPLRTGVVCDGGTDSRIDVPSPGSVLTGWHVCCLFPCVASTVAGPERQLSDLQTAGRTVLLLTLGFDEHGSVRTGVSLAGAKTSRLEAQLEFLMQRLGVEETRQLLRACAADRP